MKSKLLAAGLPALFVTASITAASAFEIQADNIRFEDGSGFQYRDNVEIRFAPEEAFEISADEITEQDGVTEYSGNVQITFAVMRLRTEKASVSPDADGNQLIETENADLTVGQP